MLETHLLQSPIDGGIVLQRPSSLAAEDSVLCGPGPDLVIEHGVDVHAYLKEMSRLLKPDGYILTSTDYWHEPIDTKGLYPYGKALGEMKVFTREDIEQKFRQAEDMD